MKFWPLKNIPFLKRGDKRTLLNAAEANELIAVLNALRNAELRRGDKDEILKSDDRITIQIKSDASSSATATGVAIKCEVTSVAAEETLQCIIREGSLSGMTITVNRPFALYASLDSITLADGSSTVVTFTYADTQNRTATATGYNTEVQKIMPPYVARNTTPDPDIIGSYIYVLATAGGAYIDLNFDGRKWQSVPYVPIP